MKTMIQTTFACTLTLLVACGGNSKPAVGTTPASAPVTVPSGQAEKVRATCVASFERQRSCSDVFLPALVDVRIKHDVPAGIAASAQKEGRDAILAEAQKEWAVDSTDEAIAKTCDRMAQNADQVGPQVDAVSACLSKTTCDDFVACELPIVEAMITR